MTRAMDRMLQLLEQIRDNTDEGTTHGSSIEVEDLASKTEPKITTKVYVGCPLTTEDIDMVLQAHAYAKRRARDMALNGWQETIDMLTARAKSGQLQQDLEELPDFEEIKQP